MWSDYIALQQNCWKENKKTNILILGTLLKSTRENVSRSSIDNGWQPSGEDKINGQVYFFRVKNSIMWWVHFKLTEKYGLKQKFTLAREDVQGVCYL